jgi:plastocyanin
MLPSLPMFRRRWPAVLLATAILAVSAPSFAKEVTVTISNFAFSPEKTTIAKGDTVKFVNADDTVHSVVAKDGAFHSDGLDTDDSFSYTFSAAGTFDYYCGLHPFMTGQIDVN